MGNKWGVIHNQSNQDMVYAIHQQKVSPFKEVINKYKGLSDAEASKFTESQKQGIFKTQIQRTACMQEGAYNLPAERISKAGLSNLDFNKHNCISIITQQGIWVANCLKISSYDDIRIRILKQKFEIKKIAKQQADKLKNFALGGTIAGGKCHKCKNENAKFREVQKPLKCRMCNNAFKELWVCVKIPQNHFYCEDCHQVSTLQNQLGAHLK